MSPSSAGKHTEGDNRLLRRSPSRIGQRISQTHNFALRHPKVGNADGTAIKTDDGASGRFVIRRDRSQLFEGLDATTGDGVDAPGASVTYSEDNLKHTRTGNFQGFASYTYFPRLRI